MVNINSTKINYNYTAKNEVLERDIEVLTTIVGRFYIIFPEYNIKTINKTRKIRYFANKFYNQLSLIGVEIHTTKLETAFYKNYQYSMKFSDAAKDVMTRYFNEIYSYIHPTTKKEHVYFTRVLFYNKSLGKAYFAVPQKEYFLEDTCEFYKFVYKTLNNIIYDCQPDLEVQKTFRHAQLPYPKVYFSGIKYF